MSMKVARFGGRLLKSLPWPVRNWVSLRLTHPGPPAAVRRSHEVTEEEIGGVRSVWLDPSHVSSGVLVYLHGGAYTFGPFEQQWQWLAMVCEQTQLAALMIDYRLAGVAAYPAAVDDAESAITFLQQHGVLEDGGWALAGESAGGGLALVTVRRLLDGGRPAPACLVLHSPWVDLAMTHPEIPATERLDPVLSRRSLAPSVIAYANGRDLDDPELSPIHADLSGMPPVHLDVGTHDIFLHDVRLLRDRFAERGVPCEYHELPRAMHGYPIIVQAPEARATIAAQAAFLRRHVGAARS